MYRWVSCVTHGTRGCWRAPWLVWLSGADGLQVFTISTARGTRLEVYTLLLDLVLVKCPTSAGWYRVRSAEESTGLGGIRCFQTLPVARRHSPYRGKYCSYGDGIQAACLGSVAEKKSNRDA